MTTTTIVLPWDSLPMTTNQARRWHWTKRRAAISAIRDAVHYLAKSDAGYTHPVVITLIWQVTDRRRRDADAGSLVLKAAIDGMVDSGLLPADDWRYVRETRCRVEPGECRQVRIEVTPA